MNLRTLLIHHVPLMLEPSLGRVFPLDPKTASALKRKHNKYWEILVFPHPSHNQWFYWTLVCKPILQAKWSNKQKTKVLCIKVHFVHFYPSNECCVKRHSFSPQLVCVYCVCVLFFSHTPKAKTQNLFFLLGWVRTSFAREIDDGYIGF